MKKILLLLVVIGLVSFVADKSIKLDATHSSMVFSIGHLGVSEIRGSVNMKESIIKMKGDDFTDAEIALTIDMATIDTDNEKRNAHLRTADFFDTEKFPDATFKSTSVKKSGDNSYTVAGDFTMHGVTKPITVSMTTKSAINPTNNKPITGVKVIGTIKRLDFGVSPGTPTGILTDEVEIIANLEYAPAEEPVKSKK